MLFRRVIGIAGVLFQMIMIHYEFHASLVSLLGLSEHFYNSIICVFIVIALVLATQASLLVLQKRILKIISQERERLVFWNSFSVLDVFQDCCFIFDI